MPDSPDRSKLPIRRPSFTGVTGKTLADSTPGWELIGHVEPPEGAPNVLLVLIDDAGFGNPSAFGGPIRHAKLRADRRPGAALQPLPRDGDVIPHAGGTAHG